ncbi:ATP-binding protein [Acaryochloris sp. IP29b_bin.137]|uniref:ATP-binding protein n=1 Tax=Acaryochloris sp. IP29b_bin.137 TaxID=2969217 RepID=UPI0026160F05|nr:ATP-binding protein [Acaryochloris sp. IP29b_bin.137]
MPLDPNQFFKACNPSKPLILANEGDRPYYINFTQARTSRPGSVSLMDELYRTITRNDDPTHQLFTGHIGCGKSTELRKLQYDLEQAGFHVVYLDSTEDLVMTDVDISDLLLTVARQISKSLATADIHLDPQGFQNLLQKTWTLLNSDVDLSGSATLPTPLPGIGSVTASVGPTGETSIDLGIAKLSARLKNNPSARARLRQHLEPQTDNLLELINQELLAPATQALQARGYKGLVAIVDSLDRLENTQERNQAEYIFVTRGEKLRQLNCHMVYTTPLVLCFSNSIAPLSDRFGGVPKVLPMARVQNRDGIHHSDGIDLLKQLILARAFPKLSPAERPEYLSEIFDHPETCDRLCLVSGGHIRNLLVLLYGCLQKQDPPLDRDTLEDVISVQRDALVRAIQAQEWELLNQVKAQKAVVGEEGYHTLLRSLFVFEYRDEKGTWFGLNPILAEAQQFAAS